MTEFNLHHNVRRLVECVDLDPTASVSEDQIVEDLQKSIKNYNPNSGLSTQFVKKLESHSQSDFAKAYEDLKARNVMEVDPLVTLLARLNSAPNMKSFLRFHKSQADKKCPKDSPPTYVSRSSSKLSVLRPSSMNLDTEELNGHTHKELCSALSLEIPNATSSPALSREGIKSNGRSSSELKQRRERSRSTSSLKSPKGSLSFLTYDLTPIDWSGEPSSKPMSSMSILEQQMILIHDLFYILVGIEGLYIRFCPPGSKRPTYFADSSVDELNKTLVDRITTICPLYAGIVGFMEEGRPGLVNQAFTASIRCFIKDYFSLITQLESHYKRGDLTLQKMWFILQNTYLNMEILYNVCIKMKQGSCIGGAVLSILHEKTLSLSGNLKASQFVTKVTADASKPYLTMLEKWITEGVIVDPHKEFFIEDYGSSKEEDMSPDCYDDSFWENRYAVVPTRMPLFLSRFADNILKTGKYLSVIKQCGKELTENVLSNEPLEYTVEDRIYAEKIYAAYNYASKQLLHLLVEESNLIGHLKSIKNYFFIDRGDYIVQFMDMAEDELLKDIDDIIPTRLESLLELAVRTSVLNSNPHNDFLGIDLQDDSLWCQITKIMNKGSDAPMLGEFDTQECPTTLRGYEAFAFKYNIKWPLSLILHRESLGCYQILFRHLFCCRFVERQLQSVWKTDKVAKGYALKTVSAYAEAFSLRQKMLNFVQNLQYHMMFEVLEPQFHVFLEKVHTKVTSIDDMMKEHTSFYESIARDCMLTQRNAFYHIVKLLQLCMEFSEFVNENQRHSVQFELQGASEDVIKAYEFNTSASRGKVSSKPNIRFVDRIKQMHEDFHTNLQQLFSEIINQQSENYTGSMLNIIHRLDFNEYYAKMKDGYGRQ